MVWNLSLQTGSEGPTLISRVVAHSNSFLPLSLCSWRTRVGLSVSPNCVSDASLCQELVFNDLLIVKDLATSSWRVALVTADKFLVIETRVLLLPTILFRKRIRSYLELHNLGT